MKKGNYNNYYNDYGYGGKKNNYRNSNNYINNSNSKAVNKVVKSTR